MGSIRNTLLLILLSSLFIHLALAANSSSSDSRCRESEWKALMELKGSLGNDSSSILSSWTGRECCSWDGITCHNSTGHVHMLDLGYNTESNFNSTLSPWLFNLSRLEFLRLNSCGFRGPIPNMFERLSSLTYLDLSANSFDFSPFPDSLCSLTTVKSLYLGNSQLKGPVPPCLGNMTSLTSIDLGGNYLSGKIPSELGYLTHLTRLDLSSSHLNSSIPSSFGQLKALNYLSLDSNQLYGTIPSTLGNLTNLVWLSLASNSLTGDLSESFFEGFKSLLYLGLGMSQKQFIVFNLSPQWIPPFQVQVLGMSSVFIGTEFPPWLRTQKKLLRLRMRNASIFGALPDWCQTAFPNLTHFDLSNNLLNGPVPTFDATNSASLKTLELSGNRMSGTIPGELCSLESLVNLSLANNQLVGRIPQCLGKLLNLAVLDLANNKLYIPYELGSLYNMTFLHLEGNNFQNLIQLTTLDIGKNELQGSIPEWIGEKFSSLKYLRLQYNNFSGEISVNLCQLPSLQILDLAHNNLVGTILPCLGSLSKMSSYDSGTRVYLFYYTDTLSYSFKGTEMEYSSITSDSSLEYAKFISLSSNHLHGEIPPELMSLQGLQGLNLSRNELTGSIPEKIGNLKHLESLDLSMNRLSGSIPQSLASIDALSYLNLSFNDLAGRIPSGNHFDTFHDPSIFEENRKLCGKLLMKKCPDDDSATSNQPNQLVPDGDDGEFDQSWLYSGIALGFAFGFLGVISSLCFKDQWRFAVFGFVDNVHDKVWVTFNIKLVSQFRRKLIN